MIGEACGFFLWRWWFSACGCGCARECVRAHVGWGECACLCVRPSAAVFSASKFLGETTGFLARATTVHHAKTNLGSVRPLCLSGISCARHHNSRAAHVALSRSPAHQLFVQASEPAVSAGRRRPTSLACAGPLVVSSTCLFVGRGHDDWGVIDAWVFRVGLQEHKPVRAREEKHNHKAADGQAHQDWCAEQHLLLRLAPHCGALAAGFASHLLGARWVVGTGPRAAGLACLGHRFHVHAGAGGNVVGFSNSTSGTAETTGQEKQTP